MNDTLREYLSYGKFIRPYLKAKKTIKPQEVRWGDKNQYFLFFPSPCKKKNTLVIYFHGGGWNSNSPKLHSFIGQKIGQEGFDCIMAGYRKAPRHRFVEIITDVFVGFQKIQQFVEENGLQYEKTVVMGSSAGAHLAALLCCDTALQNQFGFSPDAVDACIALAGPLCFDDPQTGALNYLLKGLFGTKDKSVWKKGEPYVRLTQHVPVSFFMIHSPHDGLVGYEQAQAFHEKAQQLGIPSSFYTVDDPWDTHSAYCAGIFLQDRKESSTLEKVLDILENI